MKTKKQIKQKKITADMSFAELIREHPEAVKVFLKHGMHCIGCPMAMRETIAEGAQAHGLDVKKLIDELNKSIKPKKE